MNCFFATLSSATLLGLLATASSVANDPASAAVKPPSQPNIVIIMADDV